jgi:asparagine N-glycosylation enzyme membrane subunit Stt3
MIEKVELGELFSWIKENQKKSVYLALIILVGVAYFIRISDIPHLYDQLMGLDPYVFYRYSEEIVQNGYLPQNDTMRYWPNGFDVFYEGILHSYVNVGVYYVANALFGATLMQVFQLYPAIFGALAFFVFFFLVDEIFDDKKVAFVSTAFLAFVPAFLFRTSAGFADKEPISVFLIFTTLLFFLKSMKEKDLKKKVLFGAISGATTGLCGLSWGGVIFAFETIAVYMIIEVLINRMDKGKLITLVTWFACLTPFFSLISHRYGGIYFFENVMLLPPILSIFLSFCHVFLYPYMKKFKPDKRIPEGIFSIAIWGVIGIVLAALILGTSYVASIPDWVESSLLRPIGLSGARVAESVAENQPPFFYGGTVNWWSSIGYVIFVFFGGTYLLTFFMFRDFKERYLLSFGAIIFFIFIIFSRFSPDSAFAVWNNLFANSYIYVFYGFIGLLGLFFLLNSEKKGIKEMAPGYIIIFIYSLFTVFAGRGAVRNLFSAAPPICAVAGFFVVKGYDEIKKATKDRVYGIPLYIVAALIIFTTMAQAYDTTYNGFWTSIVDGWIPTFDWIRTQTETNAVFLHWWDYGYWVQTLGERATVLDGGNYESPYNIARHFFTSDNTTEIRDVLDYYGDPNYLLIVDDDIPKFYQIQRIAEREVWFTPFYFNQKTTNPFDTDYEFVFIMTPTTGSAPTFTDLRINNRLWSSGETYVLNLLTPTVNQSIYFNDTYVYIANQRFGYTSMKINCICYRGGNCTEIRTDGFPACVVPVDQGAILLPMQTKDMLFTKLYVLNQTVPGFEIAFDNGVDFNIQGMISQGQTHTQIWKINYDQLGS